MMSDYSRSLYSRRNVPTREAYLELDFDEDLITIPPHGRTPSPAAATAPIASGAT